MVWPVGSLGLEAKEVFERESFAPSMRRARQRASLRPTHGARQQTRYPYRSALGCGSVRRLVLEQLQNLRRVQANGHKLELLETRGRVSACRSGRVCPHPCAALLSLMHPTLSKKCAAES